MKRNSGILLHISSLNSNLGIGCFDQAAYDFIDFLEQSETKYWQILPLEPTGFGNSPYQTYSAFAGNPLFIDVMQLPEISEKDLQNYDFLSSNIVNFPKASEVKNKLFKKSFQNFDKNDSEFNDWLSRNRFWIDDFALFMSLKLRYDLRPWYEWDEEIKNRDKQKITELKEELKQEILFHQFLQFHFFVQWEKVRKYAHKKQIEIIGDIPIYVAQDSADAWSNPSLFLFDKSHKPKFIAGVPPDYFSEDGQLWGNPIYDWEQMKKNDFVWWKKRIRFALQKMDIIRIDHFRAFSEYWQIPAGEKTARNGRWVRGAGQKFFDSLNKDMPDLVFIAEDLGIITDEVTALRKQNNFPGMAILQFAFDGEAENKYLPNNVEENCVYYTGTHDNNTILGWYNNLSDQQKKMVEAEIINEYEELNWNLIATVWAAGNVLAISPLQDFLALDEKSRMNTPGTSSDNWKWKLNRPLSEKICKKIKQLNTKYKRRKQ